MRKVRIILHHNSVGLHKETHYIGYVVAEDDTSLTISNGWGRMTFIKGNFELREEE